MRYTVKRVLSDDELGRFSLSPSQTAPYNAFVNRAFLQEQVDLEDRVNLVLVDDGVTGEGLDQSLKTAWRPEDIGLRFRAQDDVVQLESDRIFLSEETARAASTLTGAQGTFTYLATSLSKGEKLTPYFFVVAGPVDDDVGDDEIVINKVAGEQACGAGGGWYYDDPKDPAIITLCDATCTAVQTDEGAKIQIVLGCASQVN